jgi:integrase
MKKVLTDRTLKSLAAKPPSGETQPIIWDATLPGFGVRISRGGRLSYIVMKRPSGSKRPIRHKVGDYPVMTLQQAREVARAALLQLAQGLHPGAERDRQIREKKEADAQTFQGLVKRYLAFLESKGTRTTKQIVGLIDRHLISRWDGRPVSSISRKEVAAAIEAVRDAKGRRDGRKLGGSGAARQTWTYTRRLFGFAVGRGIIEHSPCDHLSAGELLGEKPVRQRTLTDSEIKSIWDAASWNTSPNVEVEARGRWPLAPFIRLLLLTGVRRGELGKARWNDVDPDKREWLIRAEDTKTSQPHVVPLSSEAMRIFRSLPRFTGDNPLIFTNDGKRPLGAFTFLKNELDAASGVKGWVLHDLRRSCRTNWSRLGIAPHVSELLLGHARKGIEATYDHWSYLPERREALERWAQYIHEITSPPPEDGKVVKLRA